MPSAMRACTPIEPTTIAVAMILNTVPSLSRNWPRILWNFATCPFCSRTPKTIPVTRPSTSLSGPSNMVAALLSVDEESRCDPNGENERGEHPTGKRELQCTTDRVAARAALRDACAQHHDESAHKRAKVAHERLVPKAPAPPRRHSFLRAITGELRTEICAEKDAHNEHPFPINFRCFIVLRLLGEIGIALRELRRGGLLRQRGSVLKGRGDPDRPVGRREGEPAQYADPDADEGGE